MDREARSEEQNRWNGRRSDQDIRTCDLQACRHSSTSPAQRKPHSPFGRMNRIPRRIFAAALLLRRSTCMRFIQFGKILSGAVPTAPFCKDPANLPTQNRKNCKRVSFSSRKISWASWHGTASSRLVRRKGHSFFRIDELRRRIIQAFNETKGESEIDQTLSCLLETSLSLPFSSHSWPERTFVEPGIWPNVQAKIRIQPSTIL